MEPTKPRHFAKAAGFRPLTAAALEAHMERHRRWRHAAMHEAIEEIIDEVRSLPARKPKAAMPLPFEQFDA